MRRGLGLVVMVVALLGGLAPVSHADGAMSLALGQAVFWVGGHATDSTARTWPLHLAAGAARLRVAIDTPSREDTFDVELLDPSGAVQGATSNSNQFNAEAFVAKPAGGDWTVRVTPSGATDAWFRLRAKLEDTVETKPAGHVAMLPNLKAVPPLEFGFVAPANPANAVYPPDTVNPPLDVAGIHPLSCAADEMAPVELGGGGAHTCLRLTSGPINVGRGPFDMRFDLAGDTLGGTATLDKNTVRGPAQQAVHYSDGKVELRPAGTYSFHNTHAHFHTDQILTYELFSVADPATGGLTAAGAGTKSGFCPADQLFGEWRRFSQQPNGTFGEGDSAAGGNCFSPSMGVLGLTSGWGDVYRWQRPGQYVEFDGGDGRYVVRSTVDKGNHIVEENDADNSAYAYIEVKGENVTILERGQGTDPWDPTKLVFKGAGPASVDAITDDPAVLATQVTSSDPAPSSSVEAARTLATTGGVHGWWWGVLALLGVLLLRRSLHVARVGADTS
jgi:hypothetical protein